MFKTINLQKLVSNLAITLITGIAAKFLSGNMTEIYSNLTRPPLSPPPAVFGIVWTILYILMGISLYMIRSLPDSSNKRTAVSFFTLQLAANFLWPIFFFVFKKICFSAVWLVFLTLLVTATVLSFLRLYKPAAYILIPYILWCLFALYLNIGICLIE